MCSKTDTQVFKLEEDAQMSGSLTIFTNAKGWDTCAGLQRLLRER